MLTKEEIKLFIDEDDASTKKQSAKVGEKYYEGDHDVLNHRIFYFNSDGQLVEDKARSNTKIPHPFFKELVDQATQYTLSGGDFVVCDIPELQKELDSYFNQDDFISELSEVITDCQTKGFAYMYATKNQKGMLKFTCANSIGVVEVESRFADDKKDHVIYWYIDRVDKDGKRIKKIMDWDDKQTYYYIQNDDGDIEFDDQIKANPRPHLIYTVEGDKNTYYDDFGFIPFFRLDNNKKQISNLKPIKDLIDDYDLMACGLSNNLHDASEYLVVVKGFQGDNMEELMRNIKIKKHIGVDGDDGGDVEFKTVDIPYEARKIKLDLDEKNIYRFGMGLNLSGLRDTAATTNIAIKAAYSLLDLRCNRLEMNIKRFLRKIVEVVINDINKKNGTAYQAENVRFKFLHQIMSNEQENAQNEKIEAEKQQIQVNTLLSMQNVLDDKTIVQQICEVLDIDYEKIKDKLPVDESKDVEEAEKALSNIETEEVVDEEKANEVIGKPLNGAQTSSMFSIIQQYKQNQLTADEAVSILAIAIGISEEKARKVMHIV